jgi:hypothetical protein
MENILCLFQQFYLPLFDEVLWLALYFKQKPQNKVNKSTKLWKFDF